VDRAIDCDDPQNDLVAQRFAAKRELDLLTRRRRLAHRIRWRWQR
jgi:hypothetical protein